MCITGYLCEKCRLPAFAPPRIGGDFYHARGARGVRAPGDSLFHRQGFERDATSCPKSLLSVETAVSAASCRYHLEISRNDRFSRPGRETGRDGTSRPHQQGWFEARHFADRLGVLRAYPGDEDRRAAPGPRSLAFRRGVWGRQARRGKKPGQGKDFFAPLGRPRLGSAPPTARTLAAVQH